MTESSDNVRPLAAVALGRLPPQNLDAEQSVLGGILLDNASIKSVVGILCGEDFYREAHRKVFEAMLSLDNDGTPIDRVTLKDELVARGAYEQAGGEAFVDLLDKVVPSASNLAYYAKIVHDKATARRLIEAAHAIAAQGYEQHGDVGEFIADAKSRLAAAAADGPTTSLGRAWRDLTPEEANSDPEPQRFVLYPYLPAGSVAVLSGPGGSAKTTLTVYLAVCRALGIPLFDRTGLTEGHTVLISTEDDLAAYRRKLNAWRYEVGEAYDARRVAKAVHFVDLAGESVRLIEGRSGQYHQTETVEELARLIAGRCPEASLVVLETLSRLTGGAEGNEANSIVIEAGQRLAKLLGGPAVLFVGHVSQDAGRRGTADQYAGRGGTSLGDNARSSMVLTRVTSENLKKHLPGVQVQEADMERVLLFTHPKANGGPEASPLLLERCRTAHGMVLRPFGAGGSVATRFERFVAIVRELIATTGEATARDLRPYAKDLGVPRDDIPRLVNDATKAGLIVQEKRVGGRGGGNRILPATPKERPEDRRADLA